VEVSATANYALFILLATVSLVWVNRRSSDLVVRGSSGVVGGVTAGAAGSGGR
jgi:hypothetical protein